MVSGTEQCFPSAVQQGWILGINLSWGVLDADLGIPFSVFSMDSSRMWSYRPTTQTHRHNNDMSQYSDGLNDTESANRKPRQLQKYLSDDYDKLPKQRHTIRLLNLLSSSSDNPQIECELITPKGDETKRKPYYALSWCWGKEKPSQYVSIRKGRKKYAKYVQPNLFAALHALRHHQNDRFLWIDAICINQEDLDEKNHQVEMMHEIFGNAECVCIWLGEASKSSRTALRFIKDEVLKLQNFDELCENATSTPKWRALLELMQREWFSRRWYDRADNSFDVYFMLLI